MKVKKTVTLDKEDIKVLCIAASILETLSDESRCWTPRGIRELANDKNTNAVDERYITIEWNLQRGE